MTALLVIRHAPTDWNAAGRIQGRSDVPLGNAGRARASAWRLPDGWRGASCVASPLARAMATAHAMGLDPRPDPRLIEMDWGEWEGLTLSEMRASFGGGMAENEARGLDFRPPGGESPRDVQVRLHSWLAGLAGPTVAITHKGVLRALHSLATGWAMLGRPPDRLLDGCAHAFAIGTGGLRVDQLNIPLTSSR